MKRTPTIGPNTLFVVSGGGRGITASCVVGLARRFGCRFLLLGRSQLAPQMPDWATEADPATLKQRVAAEIAAGGAKPTPAAISRRVNALTAQREIVATLQAIVAAGGSAEYLNVDITDRQALQAALAQASARLGPINGLIHGAGVLADKLIEQKRAADFDAVLTPKIAGLANLLAAVPPDQLDYLVLFASAAGFYGNPGQSDYAVANTMLNQVALQLQAQHPRCRVVALNWGPWDAGMVTPAIKEMFARRRIAVIPVDAGVQFLVAELSRSDVQPALVLAGSPMPPAPTPLGEGDQSWRITRQLSLVANPFLHDHAIGTHAVVPAACGLAWIVNACEQRFPGYRFVQCDDYRVLKGVVFDESFAAEYQLDLRASSASDTIVCEGTVASQHNGRPRYHYRARVVLRCETPDAPHYPAAAAHDGAGRPGSELYHDGTLFHGPRFQGIEEVLQLTPDCARLRCRLPAISAVDQGQFPVQTLNPFLLDIQLQSLLVWVRHTYAAASLPLNIARIEQYHSLKFATPFFVSLEVRSHDAHRLTADIFTHDANGRLYLKLTAASVTISPQLNRLFSGEPAVAAQQYHA